MKDDEMIKHRIKEMEKHVKVEKKDRENKKKDAKRNMLGLND